MEFEEKTLKRESKFKGHIFEVAVDEVLLPDGKTAGRELIFHKGAVAVLAVTLRVNWKLVRLVKRWLQQRVNLKRRLSIRVNLN